MKLKLLRSQKGLSILELMISIGLMGIVAVVGTSIYSNVAQEKIAVENRNTIRQTTATLQKVVNRIATKVTPTEYDPIHVLNFSNEIIGDAWVEYNYGVSFSSAASSEKTSSQDKGILKPIYYKTNTSQILNPTADLRNVSGCAECSSCESFDKANIVTGLCASLDRCLYSSIKFGNSFIEKISKCVNSTSSSTATKVFTFALDEFSGAQTSHDLVFSDLAISNSSSTISKENYKSNSVYMSRCVPVGDLKDIDSKYKTFKAIDNLMRPYIKSSENVSSQFVLVDKVVNGKTIKVREKVTSFNSANIECCKPPILTGGKWVKSNCTPLIKSSNPEYLPTIFVYQGEGKISTWPAPSDRILIPGLALIMQIDSITPKSFKLTTLQIENACKSGRKRINWPCAVSDTNSLIPKNGEFDTQVEVKVLVKSGSVASGLSSGGIMNLGDSVDYNN